MWFQQSGWLYPGEYRANHLFRDRLVLKRHALRHVPRNALPTEAHLVLRWKRSPILDVFGPRQSQSRKRGYHTHGANRRTRFM